ncbi:hypothetical protein LMG28140_01187 [Paraburkholderia metrosideri]|uniref:Uncharacterized protein n=1 Tax=Paraburkholderia metrosideri TaxID=580937 RepID=A0ABN7HHQ4_9BURK|nr:hypothetical protein LMG28140_01187 [Paraburkholderia metrosideri]
MALRRQRGADFIQIGFPRGNPCKMLVRQCRRGIGTSRRCAGFFGQPCQFCGLRFICFAQRGGFAPRVIALTGDACDLFVFGRNDACDRTQLFTRLIERGLGGFEPRVVFRCVLHQFADTRLGCFRAADRAREFRRQKRGGLIRPIALVIDPRELLVLARDHRRERRPRVVERGLQILDPGVVLRGPLHEFADARLRRVDAFGRGGQFGRKTRSCPLRRRVCFGQRGEPLALDPDCFDRLLILGQRFTAFRERGLEMAIDDLHALAGYPLRFVVSGGPDSRSRADNRFGKILRQRRCRLRGRCLKLARFAPAIERRRNSDDRFALNL